jgi:tRNA-splicing ligase RtcB
LTETFGSAAHGAGRVSSRTNALRTISGTEVKRGLESRGKIVLATSDKVIAEEAPQVYKDIDAVIASTEAAGISAKVARMIPMGVTKG